MVSRKDDYFDNLHRKTGDSLYAIANKYGVTVDALIYDNQIANPLPG